MTTAPFRPLALLLAALTLATCALTASAPAASAGERAGPARWSSLRGTTWYVPPANLPAILTSPDTTTVIPLRDQTVYTIDGYRDGYFWGVARTQFLKPSDPASVPPDSDPTCNRMAASVTPEGTLNVSFAPMSDTGDRITGVGVMRRHAGAWAMEMQMTSGDTAQVTHWAYMRACPKRGRCDLPAIDATAKEFVDACRSSG